MNSVPESGEVPDPPTLTPYLIVDNGPAALRWYAEVLDGHRRGEPYLGPDGKIGHAELAIGNSVSMLAEEGPQSPPSPKTLGGTCMRVHVQVADADRTVARAVAADARLVRPVRQEPYGAVGVFDDPFGHSWLVNTPPAGSGG